jgi:hypothetical protein
VPAHIVADVAREFQFDDVKPISPFPDSMEALSAYMDVMQTALTTALIHPTADDERPLGQKRRDASVTSVSPPFDIADTIPDPPNETATPVLNCETMAALNGGNETPNTLDVPATPPVALGPRQIEAGQLSGSMKFVSGGDSQLLSELAMERAPLAFSPLLHVVKAKGKFDPLPASIRRRVPSPHKPIYAPAVSAKKSRRLASRRMTLPELRPLLIRWSARWRDNFLSVVTRPAWTRLSATLLRCLKRPFHSVRALCQAWSVRLAGYLSILDSLELPRMKSFLSQWLREPLKPAQWRLPYSRQLGAGRRLSHKKM